MEKNVTFMDHKEILYWKDANYISSICRFNVIPVKIPTVFCVCMCVCVCVCATEREKEISSNFNIHMEIQNANNSQDSLLGQKKKENLSYQMLRLIVKLL